MNILCFADCVSEGACVCVPMQSAIKLIKIMSLSVLWTLRRERIYTAIDVHSLLKVLSNINALVFARITHELDSILSSTSTMSL